jgi:hypothetical protein
MKKHLTSFRKCNYERGNEYQSCQLTQLRTAVSEHARPSLSNFRSTLAALEAEVVLNEE